jgi:hypothetical protein
MLLIFQVFSKFLGIWLIFSSFPFRGIVEKFSDVTTYLNELKNR